MSGHTVAWDPFADQQEETKQNKKEEEKGQEQQEAKQDGADAGRAARGMSGMGMSCKNLTRRGSKTEDSDPTIFDASTGGNAALQRDRLAELLRQPCNQMCADCQQNAPTWASVNHGTFICTPCSGVHRSLGVHISFVLSAILDDWTTEQVNGMVSGNEAANLTLEYDVDPDQFQKPAAKCPRDVLEAYTKAKYTDKLFLQADEDTPRRPPTLQSASAVDSSAGENQGMVDNVGVLWITLVEGKDLLACDLGATSDPYCKLVVGGQRCKSKTIKATLNPVWNEQLMLSWDGQAPLFLECWDADTFSADDPMGQGVLELGESGVNLMGQPSQTEDGGFMYGPVDVDMKLAVTPHSPSLALSADNHLCPSFLFASPFCVFSHAALADALFGTLC
jgi:hypothetical protein